MFNYQDTKDVKSKVKIGNWRSLRWRQDSLSFLHSFSAGFNSQDTKPLSNSKENRKSNNGANAPRRIYLFPQSCRRVQLIKIFWTVRLAEHFCRKIGRWRRTRWVLGSLSFFLRNEAKIQFIRIQRAWRIPYENRRLTQCATHTRKSIFFTRDLARVQLSRYQGRQKQSKNRKLTKSSMKTRQFIFFTQLFGRVQLPKIPSH